MKRALLTLAALAVFAMATAPTWAEDGDGKGKKKGDGKGKRGNPESLFKKLDANGDGKVSKEEFAKMAERAKANGKGKGGKGDKIFARLDTDKDGSISLDEFKKMGQNRGKKKKDK